MDFNQISNLSNLLQESNRASTESSRQELNPAKAVGSVQVVHRQTAGTTAAKPANANAIWSAEEIPACFHTHR
jgi:hypothetical protein